MEECAQLPVHASISFRHLSACNARNRGASSHLLSWGVTEALEAGLCRIACSGHSAENLVPGSKLGSSRYIISGLVRWKA